LHRKIIDILDERDSSIQVDQLFGMKAADNAPQFIRGTVASNEVLIPAIVDESN
jgi:hypothetical protein